MRFLALLALAPLTLALNPRGIISPDCTSDDPSKCDSKCNGGDRTALSCRSDQVGKATFGSCDNVCADTASSGKANVCCKDGDGNWKVAYCNMQKTWVQDGGNCSEHWWSTNMCNYEDDGDADCGRH